MVNKLIKRLFIFFLPIWLFLFSVAQGNVNGSFGVLYEKSLKSFGLYGIFGEVNNQKFGGYLSIVGDTEDIRYGNYKECVTFANFSLGATYFVKKRFGLLTHVGFQRSLVIERFYFSTMPWNKNDIGVDTDWRYVGGTLKDWGAKCYLTYGVGIISSAPLDWATWHVKVNFVDNGKKSTYFGFGLGFHIF